MKKITLACVGTLLSAVCLFGAAACGGNGTNGNTDSGYVVNDATDLPHEDFGIAVKKGDADTRAAVNEVIDAWTKDGTMDKYLEYYQDVADATKEAVAPEGLKITWDLSGYTETLDMFTESTFPPFEFSDKDGYTVSDGSRDESVLAISGVDVAIACETAEKLHCKLVIHDVAFNAAISHLNSTEGKAIVAAGMSITDERKNEVDFSNIYHSSTLAIVCAKDAGYTTLKSLDGLKIGVQEGTSGDIIAAKAVGTSGYDVEIANDDDTVDSYNIKLSSPQSEVVSYQTYTDAFAALQAGKIDVIFMDKVPALLLVTNI